MHRAAERADRECDRGAMALELLLSQYGNVQSTSLELPVNQPVDFDITSVDVQHSFWIPAFGVKQDAVPGETTTISATPSQMGTYVVRCAELCGLYHAYMETPVYVVSASAFQTWVSPAADTGAYPVLLQHDPAECVTCRDYE